MNLRNRVAVYFVSRLFWLMVIWGILLVVSISLFSFFLRDHQPEASPLSMDRIAEDTRIQNQQIDISPTVKEDLQNNRMWLQILDENGNESFSYNKPVSIQEHYAPGELVSDYVYPANKGYQLSTWYETIDDHDLTWVMGKPAASNNPFYYWANNLWILSILVIGIFIALFFGKQLGAPLLHVVSWIDQLSKGTYEEPLQKKKRNNTKHKVYQDLMLALSNLTSTLKQSRSERELLEKSREEWMTGISHDLKTPLSTIKGYTTIMASDEYHWKQEEIRHFAKTMEDRVEYMEQLIKDFNLTFQLKNEAIPIQLKPMNLVSFIKGIVEQMEKMPDAKQQTFSFETNQEPIFYAIDSKYLKRALENLLANSSKHNPANTSVRIKLQQTTDSIHITIQDDGIGMSQETVDRLFDRYFRGTNSAEGNAGTGLGMAIAKQIILAHHGDITIKSKPNIGTECRIVLPR
ncbi:sensor histidine kinase [Gracilibacillus timonensis]|uniref:sensor histidine kinase n=1 Tax=Gracilibacillus timonensis TaxID=1816696 RepID=UPI0008257D92|nr:HAMP domain-containing sensor histidine kinase [Gracilibacillus timonensis]